MRYSVEQYAQSLLLALQEAGPKDQETIINNFIAILKDQQQLDLYEAIIEHFEILSIKANGKLPAEVTVARQTSINPAIITQLNTVAKQQLAIKTTVDPNIIGGMIIKVEDTLVDASIKGHLDRLKKTLSQ
jgi:F-type H+-transporting ATPase subunit delta